MKQVLETNVLSNLPLQSKSWTSSNQNNFRKCKNAVKQRFPVQLMDIKIQFSLCKLIVKTPFIQMMTLLSVLNLSAL